MTVLVCGKNRYTVTETDRLWLLRAVAQEGAVSEQVAQTLVNCFAYLHSRKPAMMPTLTKLIRSYAQPVNPRWFPDGDLHLRWLERGKDTPEKAAKRPVYSSATNFAPAVVSAMHKALTKGPVDIPASCTDYAAAWIDASNKYHPLTPAVKGRNRLWTRDGKWQGYKVEI